MAKTNLFRAYGGNRNDESKRLKDKNELNFSDIEVSEIPQQPQETIQKNELPVTLEHVEERVEEIESTKEILDTKKGKGRPARNPGVKTSLRTYKIAVEAIDAMEEKMFKHRKDWDKRMSLSKYITNLIWADTHNGELFYDPKTAKCLVNLEKEDF